MKLKKMILHLDKLALKNRTAMNMSPFYQLPQIIIMILLTLAEGFRGSFTVNN